MSETPALILVVGMHRSGTSLLGSLLPALGVPLPGELIAADQHNPEGYYERADITALQEQLLIHLGRWWPSPSGTDPLPNGWLHHEATRAAAARLNQLLAEERRRQPGVWAIKDPRTSLLLPLWRQVAADLQLPLKLVLSVRNPAEVMVSLLERDQHTTGMTGWRAQRLWWHHNRQLLLDAGELPLLVVDYSAWFDPHHCRRQLQELCRFCLGQRAPTPRLEAAAGLINPHHRRSRRSRQDLPQPIHPWIRRLYGRLGHLASSGSLPSRRKRLQHWLAASRRILPPDPTPGPWFEREHYRKQQPPLPAWSPLWLHYQLVGWRRGRAPHPLFNANHYRHQAQLRGVTTGGIPPLRHFLQQGLSEGIPPCALADRNWSFSTATRFSLWQQGRLEGLHPWGSAALAVCNGQVDQAIGTLERWLHQGLSTGDIKAIETAAHCQFCQQALEGPSLLPPLPEQACLVVLGANGNPNSWELHAWLQHLPLPLDFELQDSHRGSTIYLLLGPVPAGPASLHLIELTTQSWVFCTDPQAVPLLGRLGVQARLVQPGNTVNGWLNRPNDASEACRQLGLPTAQALADQAKVLCLGTGGPTWEEQLGGAVWCWPNFESVHSVNPETGRLLASWLNACNRAGLQLVRLHMSAASKEHEQRMGGWQALQPPASQTIGWLPPQLFVAPLHPQELLSELAWRAAGCPPPPPVCTPTPSHHLLWQGQGSASASAAVCVSLYNYETCILKALESVRAQTLEQLELIIVDDASSDQGASQVQHWLAQHSERFCRTLLVQHMCNGGLAAARNTAFSLAQAPWCFVLDADNQLEPQAVAACLALGAAAPPDVAVVHPLVQQVWDKSVVRESPTLISGVSWQRHHFLERNVVDAMALVRRSAWQQVGGYDHIPGGWEDYDFWCKLLEANFVGILCPQRLARYHRHSSSMLATQTHQQQRAISRVLQHRHPWLQLHLATPGV